VKRTVRIGPYVVGDDEPCFTVAEIGINHNGSLETALEMIHEAKWAGCDAVKFQKRTVNEVYTAGELAAARESIFGSTNGDLKRGLEFFRDAYQRIQVECDRKGLLWFASSWDVGSLDAMEGFDPVCHKIASPCLTNYELVRAVARTGKPIIMSTGMSTAKELEDAARIVEACGAMNRLVLMHTTSAYPAKIEDLNLSLIPWLRDRYQVPVGYSGHEVGIPTSIAAVAMGACMLERHFTLDRSMWGSDQAASVEPLGMRRLVHAVKLLHKAKGKPEKRLLECEKANHKKLRRV
jgi:N-acetylneuraminate synthase